jgi:hypothetical protein
MAVAIALLLVLIARAVKTVFGRRPDEGQISRDH